MDKSKFKMIIFDMDGLLVNTEKVYYQGWYQAVKEHELDVPQEIIAGWVGKGMHESMEELDQLTGDHDRTLKIRETREKYFFNELENGRVQLKPYAKEALTAVGKNYKIGLATSTMEEKASQILKKLDLKNYIDYPVFGSDVKRLKPAPDVYLEVLRRSGFKAHEALAVEDSIPGSTAAKAAGLSVIMVPDSEFALNQAAVPNNVVGMGDDLRIILDLF